MTAAAILHIGPQSPEQVGYDLAWEDRAGRCDEWLHDVGVVVDRDALAAETRPRATGGGVR